MPTYLGEGSPLEGGPQECSAPLGARAQGQAPAPAPAPVSSFSPGLFLTQPPAPWPERKLHNPLGAANLAEDYSQCGGSHKPGSPHPPTTRSEADGLPAPISLTTDRAPPCSQTESLTAPPLTQPGLMGPQAKLPLPQDREAEKGTSLQDSCWVPNGPKT